MKQSFLSVCYIYIRNKVRPITNSKKEPWEREIWMKSKSWKQEKHTCSFCEKGEREKKNTALAYKGYNSDRWVYWMSKQWKERKKVNVATVQVDVSIECPVILVQIQTDCFCWFDNLGSVHWLWWWRFSRGGTGVPSSNKLDLGNVLGHYVGSGL